MVRVRPRATCRCRDGAHHLRKKTEEPIGAVAPATATINVMNHFIFRGYVLGFSTSATRAIWPNKPLRFNRGTFTGGPSSVNCRESGTGGSGMFFSSSPGVMLEARDLDCAFSVPQEPSAISSELSLLGLVVGLGDLARSSFLISASILDSKSADITKRRSDRWKSREWASFNRSRSATPRTETVGVEHTASDCCPWRPRTI